MQDRPRVSEMLDAVRHFLETDVVPSLQGHKQFHARVAANVLAIVRRELESEDAQMRAEWARLAPLVRRDAALPFDRNAAAELIRRGTIELCERIQRGEADSGAWRATALAHIRQSVIEKLAVANPKFLGNSTGA